MNTACHLIDYSLETALPDDASQALFSNPSLNTETLFDNDKKLTYPSSVSRLEMSSSPLVEYSMTSEDAPIGKARHLSPFDVLAESAPSVNDASHIQEHTGVLPQVSPRSTSRRLEECPCVGCVWDMYLRVHETGCLRDADSKYSCNIGHSYRTFRGEAELIRHSRSFHCLKSEIFPCDFPGCKFGGSSGFKRKDKLRSHQKNIHLGNALPRQTLRAIKARPST